MSTAKKLTIYDIAEKAGVTTATVSRVLNNKPHVSVETREKVRAVIEATGYFASPVASNLSRGKSKVIGMLSPFFLGDFFLKIFENLHSELQSYDVVLYTAKDRGSRREVFSRIVREKRLCALLVVSTPLLLEEELALKECGLPVIMVQGQHPDFPSVYNDETIGAYKAVDYLLSLGHRDIAIVSGPPEDELLTPVAVHRIKGWRMALAAAGLPAPDSRIHYCPWDYHDAYRLALGFLGPAHDRPSAVFATSDVQAMGILHAARDLAIPVPGGLSVVGYDDIPLADYIGLTTMSQNISAMAHMMTRLFRGCVEDGKITSEHVVLQPKLVIRATTGKP